MADYPGGQKTHTHTQAHSHAVIKITSIHAEGPEMLAGTYRDRTCCRRARNTFKDTNHACLHICTQVCRENPGSRMKRLVYHPWWWQILLMCDHKANNRWSLACFLGSWEERMVKSFTCKGLNTQGYSARARVGTHSTLEKPKWNIHQRKKAAADFSGLTEKILLHVDFYLKCAFSADAPESCWITLSMYMHLFLQCFNSMKCN